MFFKTTLSIVCIFLSIEFSYCQRAIPTNISYYGNYPDSTQKILPADEEAFQINVRLLPDSRIEKYKSDPGFNYQNSEPGSEDWISKIKNWFNQQLAALSSSKTYSTIIDILYYGLMFIALILIIRGLIKADKRGLLFGKINTQKIKMVERKEDINSLDFDQLIISAIDSNNYKLAVRYLFLKSLQKLSDRGFIELKNNKTNYQYISEISNNNIASVFRHTTLRFEWIWYGNFPIDENIMKSSKKEFNELFGLLNS